VGILSGCRGGSQEADRPSGADSRSTGRAPIDTLAGFRADGSLLHGDSANGTPGEIHDLQIRSFRWAAHGDTERVVILLGGENPVDVSNADGSNERGVDTPAARTTGGGSVDVTFVRELGLVRARLRRAHATAVTDTLLPGRLAGAAYAVRAPDRSLYVDVHLLRASYARALALSNPPRVAIDLVPGGSALPPVAVRSSRVVVLTPRAGAVAYPLAVTGYARTFEATVAVHLRGASGAHADTFTTAADWSETWGEFATTVSHGPRGSVTLFVGEHSPRNGAEEGVTIPLTLSGSSQSPPSTR
jgi:hypothetical protein